MSTNSWAITPFPALSADRFCKHLAGADHCDRSMPFIQKLAPFAADGWR